MNIKPGDWVVLQQRISSYDGPTQLYAMQVERVTPKQVHGMTDCYVTKWSRDSVIAVTTEQRAKLAQSYSTEALERLKSAQRAARAAHESDIATIITTARWWEDNE